VESIQQICEVKLFSSTERVFYFLIVGPEGRLEEKSDERKRKEKKVDKQKNKEEARIEHADRDT
jgi:hypothetical protein